jgi:hypothetical protein
MGTGDTYHQVYVPGSEYFEVIKFTEVPARTWQDQKQHDTFDVASSF